MFFPYKPVARSDIVKSAVDSKSAVVGYLKDILVRYTVSVRVGTVIQKPQIGYMKFSAVRGIISPQLTSRAVCGLYIKAAVTLFCQINIRYDRITDA